MKIPKINIFPDFYLIFSVLISAPQSPSQLLYVVHLLEDGFSSAEVKS